MVLTASRGRDETVIEVRDAGPGLSDGLLRQLASGQRFNLAEGQRAGTDSTGLGLTIVLEIMKSLGGRVVLSNRQGSIEI